MVQPSHQDSNDSDPETGCNINGNKVETENTVTLQMKVRETKFHFRSMNAAQKYVHFLLL